MLQTVIGIFENSDVAQIAKEALIENGFNNQRIEINDHLDTTDELVTDGQMTDTSKSPQNESEAEEHVAMVTVHTEFTGENLLATGILGDFGAVDVNEFTEPQADS
ncbi:hypothetical protein [Dyadobacter luticola]|uniref:General stress protein 17M-like domain-containing protein n=1 Tax=Dyadobacter luticola TaxID=1979387 RepID=A0A5R9KTH7_9BACT|nr:hypothetical protein [Dyadobacter luticola]TLU99386.1 hypothetical protein FEN17_22750 [Dyadobacter luticola]